MADVYTSRHVKTEGLFHLCYSIILVGHGRHLTILWKFWNWTINIAIIMQANYSWFNKLTNMFVLAISEGEHLLEVGW